MPNMPLEHIASNAYGFMRINKFNMCIHMPYLMMDVYLGGLCNIPTSYLPAREQLTSYL